MTKKTIKALKKLDENGIKFVFTSGRATPSVRYLMDLTGIDNPMVTNNGALAFINKENLIYENPLKHEEVKELINFSESNKFFYQFYDKDTYYSNRIWPERFDHLENNSSYGMNFQVNFSFSTKPLKELELRKDSAFKFQIFPDVNKPEEERKILEKVADMGLYPTTSAFGMIEIMQNNVNKYRGLSKIGNLLGISKEEMAAIGDQDNDIPMLSNVGLSFAMGNAIDEVKKISDYIVSSNDDFGLVEAINIVLEKNSNV
ncbi:HAD family hydrolase [Anaerococcus hydrogenalis]|uniref:HAD family hydrolase n=1 Tax=Anaerococcus hydrogenalis TaxID=33029 RepID=UPI0034C6BC27